MRCGNIPTETKTKEGRGRENKVHQKNKKKQERERERERGRKRPGDPSASEDGLSECKQSNQRMNPTFIFY